MGNHHHYHSKNERLVKQAEERMQRERHEHERRMKELENADKEQKRQQKKQNIDLVQGIIGQLNKDITKDQSDLQTAEDEAARYKGMVEKLKQDIANFSKHKEVELANKRIHIKLDVAEEEYNRDRNEVKEAIGKTGQHEGNVGKFLTLTLSLIGTTMDNQAETNKLDIALATFGKILNDECQDKLTIESYFNEQNLNRFIPILGKEGYKTLDHLMCDDEKAFEKDVLTLLEKGIEAESKEEATEEATEEIKQELEGDELCISLLKKWKLDQYWDKLQEDGWDDADDWLDLTEDDLSEIIIKKGHRNKFMKQSKKWKEKGEAKEDEEDMFSSLKQMEKSTLKRICLKPDSWQETQNQKIAITKEGLLELSPVLSQFFGKMNDAVKQISELLTYKKQLTDTQKNAIKMRNENGKKLKAIKMRKTDNDQRRKWTENSECQIYSDSLKKWFPAKIIEIKRDDEGEWLNVQYTINNDETRNKQIQRYSDAVKPLKLAINDKDIEMQLVPINDNDNDDDSKDMDLEKQCSSLIAASVVSINVTDSMISLFNKNELTERGLTLAIGVEDACLRIIHGQGQIRQSVFLAQDLLNLKPGNMKDKEREKLWAAIDNGIVQILKSALEMVKVSNQYFAFFLRFRASFQFFTSCYSNNKDTKLIISLERLRRDIREFNAFTANFSETIESLSKTSMDCIGECVKNQIGAENWEKSRSSLKRTEERYITLKKEYDQEAAKLDNEFDKKKQEKVNYDGLEAGAKYQAEMLTKRIKQNNDYLKECQAALNQLQSVVI